MTTTKKTHFRFINFRARSEKRSPVKIHICPKCSKSFSLKKYLEKHMKVHNEETPYSCQRCDESFLKQDDLIKHIIKHTVKKSYRCVVCTGTMTFATPGRLRRHMMIHTGDNPSVVQSAPWHSHNKIT